MKQTAPRWKRRNYFMYTATILLAGGFLWFCMPFAAGLLNIGNFSGLALCAFLLFWLHSFRFFQKWAESKNKRRLFCRINQILGILLALGAVWAIWLTGLIVCGMGSSPPANTTIVVLGCQVRGTSPSLELNARICTAAEFLRANPKAVCIASGGQGIDEGISEAQCIRDSLIQLGIEPSRVLLEERSTNTRENIAFSMDIMRNKQLDTGNITIVTGEYHEYRAKRIAAREGADACSIGAPTPWYLLPASYPRELMAITNDFLFHSGS